MVPVPLQHSQGIPLNRVSTRTAARHRRGWIHTPTAVKADMVLLQAGGMSYLCIHVCVFKRPTHLFSFTVSRWRDVIRSCVCVL
jgi:hypothetical protein